MTDQMSIAVIADIIASKKTAKRAEIQDILVSIIKDINQRFSTDIESDLTITLGDEFQGIVGSIETAFLIIDLISLDFQLQTKKQLGEEVTLRWGIGLGRLSTPIKNRRVSIGTDGPAYWYAREAIESVHQYDDYGQLNEKLSTNHDTDEFYNSIIRLQNVLRNDWTTSQKETAFIVVKTCGYDGITNQAIKIAMKDYLGQDVSEQTVSKRLISTHIKQYISSRRLLAAKLEERRESHDH